jgi:hypothetical protein
MVAIATIVEPRSDRGNGRYGHTVLIGIIGSGRIGSAVARLAAAAGHHVSIANSRGPGSLAAFAEELGHARAETVAGAARAGELVVIAVPYRAALGLDPEPFEDKAVVDANNYFAGRDGSIQALEGDTTTSSELLAAHLAAARVVKAFNTIHFESLAADGRPDAPRDERLAIPLAADDREAKRLAARLIDDVGFAPLDVGPLAAGGRLMQPAAPFFNRPLLLPEAEAELARHRDG